MGCTETAATGADIALISVESVAQAKKGHKQAADLLFLRHKAA